MKREEVKRKKVKKKRGVEERKRRRAFSSCEQRFTMWVKRREKRRDAPDRTFSPQHSFVGHIVPLHKLAAQTSSLVSVDTAHIYHGWCSLHELNQLIHISVNFLFLCFFISVSSPVILVDHHNVVIASGIHLSTTTLWFQINFSLPLLFCWFISIHLWLSHELLSFFSFQSSFACLDAIIASLSSYTLSPSLSLNNSSAFFLSSFSYLSCSFVFCNPSSLVQTMEQNPNSPSSLSASPFITSPSSPATFSSSLPSSIYSSSSHALFVRPPNVSIHTENEDVEEKERRDRVHLGSVPSSSFFFFVFLDICCLYFLLFFLCFDSLASEHHWFVKDQKRRSKEQEW